MTTYFIAGGAGFIGGHMAEALLSGEKDARVVVFDNFSSGREWHLDTVRGCPRLSIVRGDVKEITELAVAMKGADVVYHFASNPDIAKAMTEPAVDFWEGTYLTNNVVEAMRMTGAKKILYASGSGVYGDTGLKETGEDYAPLLPISTYGASKLAGESLICSYCHMFGLWGAAFRFANVVGPRQTHGVGYDFVKSLRRNPKELTIMGDGRQSKSYIHVADAVAAMRLVEKEMPAAFSCFNVATEDYVTVDEIAKTAVRLMKLRGVAFRHTGGDRGWKGDVPVVRFLTARIRGMGWKNRMSSTQAIENSIMSIIEDARANSFGWDEGRP